jgi:hypothetical protein
VENTKSLNDHQREHQTKSNEQHARASQQHARNKTYHLRQALRAGELN